MTTNLSLRRCTLHAPIPTRPTLLPHPSPHHQTHQPHQHQHRHASLLRRPKRPYTFTQLITLSDGSTFTHRTTSPLPIYKSTKDTRNSPLWNPSSQKLMNVEEDEAGRLRAFRMRFGRGWDAEGTEMEGDGDGEGDGRGRRGEGDGREGGEEEESLLDLITGFGRGNGGEGEGEMRGEVVGVGREKKGGKGKLRR